MTTPFDIREMFVYILTAADSAFLKNADLVQFEQGLIDETRFLLPLEKNERMLVEQYIHQHAEELQRMARARKETPMMPKDEFIYRIKQTETSHCFFMLIDKIYENAETIQQLTKKVEELTAQLNTANVTLEDVQQHIQSMMGLVYSR